ncbi:arylmalonate decarboxylase [Verticiella sediminum]|uniref:Arylmalonate decarboxylase n=1 Tax=Verticiella sediminum TaxID=1247510 RepID=A0A556AGM4_9BURK|nr:aspartate/glutamate racemase family protein [Verticiella sediminum]TSH92029.1 arylmalonate decarboxylase [Verticiella sediminum]
MSAPAQPAGATAPLIGLIVPPAHGRVPPDGTVLFPQLRFIARGLGLTSVTPAGYDGVIDTVLDHARALRDAGAQAISLMGTSLSFYRGPAFNRELVTQMRAATGLPCTTMSDAIVAGLRALGARRVAVATGYVEEVNACLLRYLAEEGFEATVCRGLGVAGVEAMQSVGTPELVGLCREVHAAAPGSDAILLSCGGLMTLDVVPQVERELGVPVVASSPAGFWDVARLAGHASPTPERGALLAAV